MRTGDDAAVAAPSGGVYLATYDHTEASYKGGRVWVGHLRGYGHDYPVLFSSYAGEVNGSIATPDGTLLLQGTEQDALLIDPQAADEHPFEPTMDDTAPSSDNETKALVASSIEHAALSADAVSPASAASPAQIDLLILFTTQLQDKLGSYSATIARLNLLVAAANNAYASSGIYISLNLVYAQAVDYSYNTAQDSTVLVGMKYDPTVTALRDQYGADIVAMVRPFQASTCGLSTITQNFAYSGDAISVVEDGSNNGAYCDITTLPHELGHLMGAAHDVATTVKNNNSVNGFPSYNRGYCNGGAGTIMAYGSSSGCSPITPYFSNPGLESCKSSSCGVPTGISYTVSTPSSSTGTTTVTGADSVSAINANAPLMAAWRSPPSKFTSLIPARVLDTRVGAATADGLFAGGGALGANGQFDLAVAGRGGVPAIRAGAVVLNVTAVNPTAAGYITAWPTGSARPETSNLNFTVGDVIPNLVVTKLGTDGKVSLYNPSGKTNLVADVAGWFPDSSSFAPLQPSRLLDTRTSGAAVQAGAELDLTVTGRGGVPASGVGAVVLNLTVTSPSAAGFVTAWPAGTPLPVASNINFVPGQTVANLAIVKVGANGQVALYNSSGNTHLVADVVGWFPATSELTALTPARVLDTRSGAGTSDNQFAGAGAIGTGSELDLTVTGRGGVPSSGVGAVVLNIAAVAPSAAGYLTVWPAGSTRPNASNLNFAGGTVVQNLVIAKVGSNGRVAIYNPTGNTDVVADVVGWFAASP